MTLTTRSWHTLAGLFVALGSCFASAQTQIPPGVHLGMSAAELREVVPNLHQVRRPQTISGAVGNWRSPDVRQGGFVFEETFFFAQQGLQRVELLLQPEINAQGDEAFADLVASLRVQYGPELPLYGGMSGVAAGSASWVHEDMDILAVKSGPPGQARTRLIYKARVLKDASEL